MASVIKTSLGTGSPGYTDDNAPEGGQWLKGVPPKHEKVADGTKVEKTGKKNDFMPAYYCEVKLLSGPYIGDFVWVKNTHVVELAPVEPPVLPPVEDMVPGVLYKVETYVKLVPVEQ